MSWNPDQPPGPPPGWQGPGPPQQGWPPAPPGPPQQGWSPAPAPGYGYGGYQPPREHPQGTTVLVLGLLSLVICQLLGPVALIMGNKALKEVDQSPVPVSNRGSIQAGRICGLIATLLLILVAILIIPYLVSSFRTEADT